MAKVIGLACATDCFGKLGRRDSWSQEDYTSPISFSPIERFPLVQGCRNNSIISYNSLKKGIVLGTAKDFLAKHGKWNGRSLEALNDAMNELMMQKSKSTSGVVTTLCYSPGHGTRLPRNTIQAKQCIVGDFFGGEDGLVTTTKNNCALLGDDNLLVEGLVSAVSVCDAEMVEAFVKGATAPRLDQIWVTGDNMYVAGLDMSWENFGVGDLLVMANAVIINTGYPHFACWKYAVRAGELPKAFINSEYGVALRARGIKGALLLPSSSEAFASISIDDGVRIVHRDAAEYDEILGSCRAPHEPGTRLIFHTESGERCVEADDVRDYVDLMVSAGCEASRIDAANYRRELPNSVREAMGMVDGQLHFHQHVDLGEEAMSGDHTIEHVGIKMDGLFQCKDCNQRFAGDRARQIHWKMCHDPDRHHEH
eukprot:TRINITY_DN14796_c0_g2_i1.p1 TRINITY_DN14796_c0_g2~~TRINITY_DN14796_c0_g2_i1.p1  ORF type:complete len:424 (+),score=87.21 TRINITY_DN14796_c0_g2_i1:77-1348(+)